MVNSLPEELLEQAELLLALSPNQANVRRAISAAYYSLFHLLIRATVSMWSDPLHQARIARIFDHDRMRKVSGATTKDMESQMTSSSPEDNGFRTELAKVAQAFVVLQQARHEADYNLDRPLAVDYARQKVGRARAAFESWEKTVGSDVAKEYLFSLLFKEKERS